MEQLPQILFRLSIFCSDYMMSYVVQTMIQLVFIVANNLLQEKWFKKSKQTYNDFAMIEYYQQFANQSLIPMVNFPFANIFDKFIDYFDLVINPELVNKTMGSRQINIEQYRSLITNSESVNDLINQFMNKNDAFYILYLMTPYDFYSLISQIISDEDMPRNNFEVKQIFSVTNDVLFAPIVITSDRYHGNTIQVTNHGTSDYDNVYQLVSLIRSKSFDTINTIYLNSCLLDHDVHITHKNVFHYQHQPMDLMILVSPDNKYYHKTNTETYDTNANIIKQLLIVEIIEELFDNLDEAVLLIILHKLLYYVKAHVMANTIRNLLMDKTKSNIKLGNEYYLIYRMIHDIISSEKQYTETIYDLMEDWFANESETSIITFLVYNYFYLYLAYMHDEHYNSYLTMIKPYMLDSTIAVTIDILKALEPDLIINAANISFRQQISQQSEQYPYHQFELLSVAVHNRPTYYIIIGRFKRYYRVAVQEYHEFGTINKFSRFLHNKYLFINKNNLSKIDNKLIFNGIAIENDMEPINIVYDEPSLYITKKIDNKTYYLVYCTDPYFSVFNEIKIADDKSIKIETMMYADDLTSPRQMYIDFPYHMHDKQMLTLRYDVIANKLYYRDHEILTEGPAIIMQWIYNIPLSFIIKENDTTYKLLFIDYLDKKLYKYLSSPWSNVTTRPDIVEKYSGYHIATISYNGLSVEFPTMDAYQIYLFYCIFFMKTDCLYLLMPKYVYTIAAQDDIRKKSQYDPIQKMMINDYGNTPYTYYFSNMFQVAIDCLPDSYFSQRVRRGVYSKKYRQTNNILTQQFIVFGEKRFSVLNKLQSGFHINNITEKNQKEIVHSIQTIPDHFINAIIAFLKTYRLCTVSVALSQIKGHVANAVRAYHKHLALLSKCIYATTADRAEAELDTNSVDVQILSNILSGIVGLYLLQIID